MTSPHPATPVIDLFSTPLGRFQLPNSTLINPGLAAIILQRQEEQDSEVVTNNIGGWHSSWDLWHWPGTEIETLKEWITLGIHYMIGTVTRQDNFNVGLDIYAWANINRAHCYRDVHTHPYSHWSGVYYVNVGDYSADADPQAGQIIFEDPRGAIGMFPHPGSTGFGASVPVKPTEGTLLVFPSWLAHSVRPFETGPDRLSISFNARISDFKSNG